VKSSKSQYLNLIQELARVDFKIKYQGSLIGYLWTLVKPLALFGVLYVIFTKFIRIGSTLPHYPIYLLLGVVLWSYFAEATVSGMRSIVDRQEVIRKVAFPRVTLLIASSISAFITLILNLLAVIIFATLSHTHFGDRIVLFIPVLLELFILTIGASAILATLYTKYRDIGHIWEVGLQLLFYASAIIFPLSLVSLRYQRLLALNPITQVAQDARSTFIDNSHAVTAHSLLHGPILIIPYVLPVIICVGGLWLFNRSAKRFAEEV